MRAGEVMKRDLEVVHPDATIEDVAARFARDATPLPVCEGGRLLGIVRPEDLIGEPTPGFGPRRVTRIRDRMAPDVVYCFESTDVEEAAAFMEEQGIDRMPVLDQRRVLVGMLVLRELSALRPGPA